MTVKVSVPEKVLTACGLPLKRFTIPCWKVRSRASKALMLSILVKEQRNPDENEMEIVGFTELQYIDQEKHNADMIHELEIFTMLLEGLDRDYELDMFVR